MKEEEDEFETKPVRSFILLYFFVASSNTIQTESVVLGVSFLKCQPDILSDDLSGSDFDKAILQQIVFELHTCPILYYG
jgi:hypothetical protein